MSQRTRPGTKTLTIIANGKRRQIDGGITVADFLVRFGLSPMQVVVEYNGEPLERKSFSSTRLNDDDCLEVAQMVGGG